MAEREEKTTELRGIEKLVGFFFGKKEAKLRAAKRAEKEERYQEAASHYRELGMLEKAEEMYRKAGLLSEAASMYEENGMLKKAAALYQEGGDYEMAVRIYLNKLKDIEKAASTYEEVGRKQEAAQLLEKHGIWERAATLYESIGLLDRAGVCYEKAGKPDKAAWCFENWVDQIFFDSRELKPSARIALQKAIDLYEQAGDVEKALSLARKVKWHEKAAEILSRQGNFLEAAREYEEAGAFEKAAELYRRAGEPRKANMLLGEYYLSEGQHLKAAEHFELAGDYGRAAELYEWNGELKKAAECYFKDGLWNKAGELYRLAGEVDKALVSFEKAGEFSKAGEVLKEMADKETDGVKKEELYRRAEAMFRKGRNWFQAGSIAYYYLGDEELAIENLQRVERQDPEFERASFMLGKLFLDKKEYELAEERFKIALKGEPISKSNLDIYYFLGLIAEAQGKYQEAYEMFKSVSSIDINYLDARERMQKLAQAVNKLKELEEKTSQPQKRYRIIALIGKGGMGSVYKAEDTVLNRTVALKLLKKELDLNKRAIERFLAEAKTAAKLSHPNIVIIYDVGKFNDRYFIAMEYLEGKTLLDYLKEKGKFTVKQVLFVATKLFSALQYAHRNGVIHRDIKPQNIMLTKDKKLKVMDFGLAVLASEIEKERGKISGTPFYMSPEQCKGAAVDERSDIYSAGATLYHLLASRPPFLGKDRIEVMKKHIEEPPLPPSTYRPGIPEALDNFIMKCLQKEKSKRFQNAGEALGELKLITKKILGG